MIIQTMSYISYPVYQDAIKQPHLLIAGTTGSGKSTIINALIYTAVNRFPGCKLILIDSKGIELYKYHAIMQCGIYADNETSILQALKRCENTLTARFKAMRKDNVTKYNGPPIFLIIDEYADLVLSDSKKEIQRIIQRICQLGRAAGIHSWIATQNVITKVIDSRIKCNIDSRIGLRTRSKQESRNIIDMSGLETLPRYGKAYYMTPETAGYINIPMIPETEIQKLIQHYSRNKKP